MTDASRLCFGRIQTINQSRLLPLRKSWNLTETVTVHSDLQAVGLTAAVAEALTKASISCNVVAAAFHDHIFVPVERATDALAQLMDLQSRAAQGVAG